MSAKTKIFGIEKFKGLLLVGSLAVSIEYLMGLCDSIVAGNMLGEHALAGINLLQPILSGVTFFAGMIGVGMSVNYSLENGRCRPERAMQFFVQGVWTTLIIGSALMLLLAFGRESYLGFMGAGDEALAFARHYWVWFVPVALLEPIAIFLLNCCYADGDKSLCMCSYIVQLSVNAGSSFLFVWLGMGTAGCALGTVVANIVAILVLALHFRRSGNSFRWCRYFCFRDTLKILKTSFGDSSSFLCIAAFVFFITKLALSQFGEDILPAVSVVVAAFGFTEVFDGIGSALQPIASVYAGERNSKALRLVANFAVKFSFLEGLVVNIVLMIFPGLVVRMVGLGPENAVYGECCTAVRLMSVGFAFTAIAGVVNSFLVVIERETMSVFFTFFAWLVVPAITISSATYIFCNRSAMWLSMGLSYALALALFFLFVLVRYGRDLFPLMLSHARDAKIFLFDLVLDEKGIAAASARVAEKLLKCGVDDSRAMRASLMTEEVFMAVRDRNVGEKVLAEASLDLNDGDTFSLTLRDDGEIFNITDADQEISSLRSFLVASVMEAQSQRMNMVTTGFNRNVFRF